MNEFEKQAAEIMKGMGKVQEPAVETQVVEDTQAAPVEDVDDLIDVEPGVTPQADPEVKEPDQVAVTEGQDLAPATEPTDLENIDDWDVSVEIDGKQVPEAEIDYSSLGKDLGLDEVKSKEDLVKSFNKKIESVKAEVEQMSKDALASVPNDLKEAIEIAKNGGDYVEFLGIGTQNFDMISAQDLFANSVANHFVDENGRVDKDGLEEYLDNFSEKEIQIEGEKIRSALKSQQEAQKREFREKAAAIKRENDIKLQAAVDKLSDVNGFKVNQYQKSILFSNVSSGKMMNDLFYDSSGNLNFDKVVSNYFKVLNHDKIVGFLKQRIRNSTKKEIIEGISNVDVTTPVQRVSATPTKKSGVDLLMEQAQKAFGMG